MRSDIAQLIEWQACQESIDFVQQFDSIEQAWQRCDRGDWMLWLAARAMNAEPWSEGRKLLLRCAIECGDAIASYWTERSTHALATVNGWLIGEAVDQGNVRYDSQTAFLHSQSFAPPLTVAACAYADAICLAASDEFISAVAGALAGTIFQVASSLPLPRSSRTIITFERDSMLKQTAIIVRSHYPHCPLIVV